jgi:hypothetical protein
VFPDRYHAEITTSPRQARHALSYVIINRPVGPRTTACVSWAFLVSAPRTEAARCAVAGLLKVRAASACAASEQGARRAHRDRAQNRDSADEPASDTSARGAVASHTASAAVGAGGCAADMSGVSSPGDRVRASGLAGCERERATGPAGTPPFTPAPAGPHRSAARSGVAGMQHPPRFFGEARSYQIRSANAGKSMRWRAAIDTMTHGV